MQEWNDFALPYGVTEGLSWRMAIFQVGDFSVRIPRGEPRSGDEGHDRPGRVS